MFFEFGWSGQSETTGFHGLSGGKTSRAARIASASGVLNITGFVIAGIFGRGLGGYSPLPFRERGRG